MQNFMFQVDQAHRGYEFSTDGKYSSLNPLYMKYSPGIIQSILII